MGSRGCGRTRLQCRLKRSERLLKKAWEVRSLTVAVLWRALNRARQPYVTGRGDVSRLMKTQRA